MSEGSSRRAVAEVRFGEDRSSITKVGGRSIHQYWSLLAPHFRDVLLAPQRRSDDGGVSWTWREAADKKPPTAAELAGVRKRLERANESFAENPVNPLMGDARSGTSSQVLIDQVATRVKAMAESLAGKSDVALADFVCRTESGAMIHSWGVASAAQIYYPDALESGVSGVVLVGGKPSAGHEVVIENSKGLSVARMRSDESGEFGFPKIGPGRYRVRVTSGKVKFSAKGVMVTVERGAMARLELTSTSNPNEADESAATPPVAPSTETSSGIGAATSTKERAGGGWFWKVAGVLLLLVLLVGGGIWAWQSWSQSDAVDERTKPKKIATWSTDRAPGGEAKPVMAMPAGSVGGDGGGLGVSADGVGRTIHPTAARPAITTNHQPTGLASGGIRHSVSTIGSKIEVQSGAAAGARDSEESGADDASAQSDSSGETAGPDSVEDRASAISMAGGTGTASVSRQRRPGASSGASIPGATPQGGGASAGAVEAISVENNKLSPSGKTGAGPVVLSGAKKTSASPAQGVVSMNTPLPGEEGAPDASPVPGPAPEDAPPSDDPMAAKPDADGSQIKAPLVKTEVVNKGATDGSPAGGDLQPGEGSTASAEMAAPAPKSATTKRGKRAPGAGSPVSSVGPASVADASAGASPENDDAAPPQPAVGMNPAEVPNNSKSGNDGEASSSDNSTAAEGSAAVAPKDGSPIRQPGPSVTAKGASKRSPVAANSRTATSSQNSQPTETPVDVSPAEPEKPAAYEPASPADGTTGAGAAEKTVAAEVTIARWEVRLSHDVIVPTLPVRAGEDDALESVRKKMLLEQKAREPDTFKHPMMRCGFAFERPGAAQGEVFRWQDSTVTGLAETTARGNRAEIAWPGGTPPGGSAQVLLFSDGREAVRLAVNQSGGVSLKVTEGVRGSVWLGVVPSIMDKSSSSPGERTARFRWQASGASSSLLDWQPETLVVGNREQRIGFRLEPHNAVRMKFSLDDRLTGWALVTSVQLQPTP